MARKHLPAMSPSETEVLRIVWLSGKATVQEVCDKLPRSRRIAYATVQTLLRRLEAKGYLTHETRGKAHVFAPAVAQDKVIRRAVGDFVEKLFGGDPVPLMLHLAEQAELNDEDIRRLRRLIAGQDK